ncbi:MAG: 2,3-bisphosphoglycerate-independent phosphoglycerate mutase, partial [Alphaproteobacteria bacterium]|nr:2,3-bisphosphoglycerate-independent phosphoglycerate mutase [Alphaproteobacteria bacterium]
MREKLHESPLFAKPRGPVVLVIMDGVGIARHPDGDATAKADMPNYRKLVKDCPYTTLKAHGTAVGLPSDDDMGNSEVGHNAIGAGRVFAQGAKLVQQAIDDGSFFGG